MLRVRAFDGVTLHMSLLNLPLLISSLVLPCTFPVRCFSSFPDVEYIFTRLQNLHLLIHCIHTSVPIQYLEILRLILFSTVFPKF